MSLNPKSELIALVENALPILSGVTPSELHRLMGGDRSSPAGVGHVLLHLVRSGRATREGEIQKYRYRRAAQ